MKVFVIPKWRMIIAAPPKNGSTSVKRALDVGKVAYELKKPHKLPDYPVYFIVRQPLDRFNSLWRFRCVSGGDSIHGTGRDLHGMTRAQFWRYVRKAPVDQHWQRQSEMLDVIGNVTSHDVTLIRLDDLSKWWKTTPSKAPLHRINETHGRIISDYRLEQAILKHYEDDVILYEEAKWLSRPE